MPQVEVRNLDWNRVVAKANELKLSHILVDPVDNRGEVQSSDIEQNLHLAGSHAQSNLGLYYRQTTRIDVTRSDEELKEQLKKKHRYNLKLSQEAGVQVRVSFAQQGDSLANADNAQADKDLETCIDLIMDTAKRQKYFARDREYYRQIWNVFKQHGAETGAKVGVAIAEYQGQPLVTWMLYTYGDTVYYPYGGSSDAHRDVMPAYSLVWEVVQWAKVNGYKYFDLWGTDEANPDSGFTRFKLGWGGEVVTYANSFDVVISPFWYMAFRASNAARWILLRVKKSLLG
jgi:lipid II:glycine glycyltransferase (peptidoglycan interpeptide bridge formation enzyme)